MSISSLLFAIYNGGGIPCSPFFPNDGKFPLFPYAIRNRSHTKPMRTIALLLCAFNGSLAAQVLPYENPLLADPPYYRVRYEASTETGKLEFPASYTVWIPPGLKTLRGLIVHQHGCGEGSCKSGQTGAFDLHWQALAGKHDCALMGPSYEQPEMGNCQLWCDPRNGSDASFQRSLTELGAQSLHPELATVPWAIWGHSGGGHWAGGMLLLHPDRVAAAWLRSGVPPLKFSEGKPTPYFIHDAACQIPIMCNLGTKEGVTVKDGRFAGVWGGVETFFKELRGKGGLVCVAVDPLTSHECGNQRYLAIPWLDACLLARLADVNGAPLKPMPNQDAWVVPLQFGNANVAGENTLPPVPIFKYEGRMQESGWLPSEAVAKAWMQYVKDTAVTDITPPPAPTSIRILDNELTWEAKADLESGLASFLIERDGQFLANVPDLGKNPYGRPVFQNLQYSDTPSQPLFQMRFIDTKAESGKTHRYRVISVNTVGLKSR